MQRLVLTIGVLVLMGLLAAPAGAAPLLLLLGVLARVRHEERTLHEGLPAYEAYAGRTKRLVPFVW